MTKHTFTIPLTDGATDIDDFHSGSRNDTTFVTLTDDGDLSDVTLRHFGLGKPTEHGESDGGDDEVHADQSGFNDDFSLGFQSVDEGDTIFISGAIVTGPDAYTVNGNVYTINFIGSDDEMHTLIIDLESGNDSGIANIVITCFAEGTMIETDQGPCAVEDLGPSDQVLCGDSSFRPIQWTAKRDISAPELELHPDYRPIRIRKNSLGQNKPERDLVVSPQHRILIDDWRAELMFGSDEVLVPAKYLVNDHSITTDYQCQDVTYYHFMLDSHQTVFSNGIETETFHPGDMALSGITDSARNALFTQFPQLENKPESFGPTYRPTLKSYEATAFFIDNGTH